MIKQPRVSESETGENKKILQSKLELGQEDQGEITVKKSVHRRKLKDSSELSVGEVVVRSLGNTLELPASPLGLIHGQLCAKDAFSMAHSVETPGSDDPGHGIWFVGSLNGSLRGSVRCLVPRYISMRLRHSQPTMAKGSITYVAYLWDP